MTPRPNFLCVVTDQQRADHLGCAGNPILRTPNLDRLAAQGVRFRRAYCNNPLCMPVRATWFTGRTPRGHTVRTNGIPLPYDIPTMTDALHQAGYRTHGIGKFHLRPFGIPNDTQPGELDPRQFPESQKMWQAGRVTALPSPYYGLETTEFAGGHGSWMWGDYARWLQEQRPDGLELLQKKAGRPTQHNAEQAWKSAIPEELHPSAWVGDRAIAFLEDAALSSKPFFLWCSFPDPHHPYNPPSPWCDMYDPADVPPPIRREGELDDLPPFFREVWTKGLKLSGRFAATQMLDEQLREIVALTFGMISLLDYHVGRILAALDRLGLRGNTVIVFMSDHGEMMGDHWLINKGPFHFDGLLRVPLIWSWPGHFPAGLVPDALASHLDFAPTVLDLAGAPLPEGPVSRTPEAPHMPPAWPGVSLTPLLRGEKRAVRECVIVENDEDYLGLRLRTLITAEHQLTIYAGQDYGELFDLRDDPNQERNLWRSPAHRCLRDKLALRLLHELAMTDSALPRRLCHA